MNNVSDERWWIILGSILNKLAIFITPIVIGVSTAYLSSAIKEKEIESKYVELAIGILAEEPGADTKALREWAIKVVDKYSDIDLSPEVQKVLQERRLELTQSDKLWGKMGALKARPGPSLPLDQFEEGFKVIPLKN